MRYGHILSIIDGEPRYNRRYQDDGFNKLKPILNDRHFADGVFRRIFMNGIYCVLIKVSLEGALTIRINNNLVMIQIMMWSLTGD